MKYIKYLFTLFLGLYFSGCLFLNECGVSYKIYDDKKNYYDAAGNYVEECPKSNIFNFRKSSIRPTDDGF